MSKDIVGLETIFLEAKILQTDVYGVFKFHKFTHVRVVNPFFSEHCFEKCARKKRIGRTFEPISYDRK